MEKAHLYEIKPGCMVVKLLENSAREKHEITRRGTF
jgi:hypothetical protein